jgi:hypothetical protein
MDYGELTKKLVADAIKNKLPGLTKTMTLHYFVSDGGYNAESDSNSPVYNDVPDVVCIAAKPTFADVQDHGAVFTDTKLIIPGKFMPAELQDRDRQGYARRRGVAGPQVRRRSGRQRLPRVRASDLAWRPPSWSARTRRFVRAGVDRSRQAELRPQPHGDPQGSRHATSRN